MKDESLAFDNLNSIRKGVQLDKYASLSSPVSPIIIISTSFLSGVRNPSERVNLAYYEFSPWHHKF